MRRCPSPRCSGWRRRPVCVRRRSGRPRFGHRRRDGRDQRRRAADGALRDDERPGAGPGCRTARRVADAPPPPVRQDNTGYDLVALFVGAEGTSVITAVDLRLYPLPVHRVTALCGFTDLDALVAAGGRCATWRQSPRSNSSTPGRRAGSPSIATCRRRSPATGCCWPNWPGERSHWAARHYVGRRAACEPPAVGTDVLAAGGCGRCARRWPTSLASSGLR